MFPRLPALGDGVGRDPPNALPETSYSVYRRDKTTVLEYVLPSTPIVPMMRSTPSNGTNRPIEEHPERMQEAFYSLSSRLVPAEDLFFKWLARVFAAAVLVGTAWIDDAPPLEGGAFLIAAYVAARVVSQFGAFARLAPFQSRMLRVLSALIALVLLVFAFVVVAIFTGQVADYVVG